MYSNLIIREATISDASAIAQAIAMAIADEQVLKDYCGEDYLFVLKEIASKENTQYSWQNCIIATINSEITGVIIGYNGAELKQLREGTFEILKEYIPTLPEIEDETSEGEYYLDAIAVFPKFRGQGIGKTLLEALENKAYNLGHKKLGLLVDFNNPNAEKLYTSVGYKRVNTVYFFNHKMWHLQKNLY